MELTRFDENDYSQRLSESLNGEWVRLADAAAEISKLRQALRAAEAECAEWRDKAGFPPCQVNKIGWGTDSERNWEALIPAADANDATRARLGLGKIGGGE